MYIGLDVDDKNFTASIIAENTGETLGFKSRPSFEALHKKLKPFLKEGYELRVCYEATYIGFSLKRQFDKAGIHCDVIAPSMIPEIASNRVKTDRLDSEKLSSLLQKRAFNQGSWSHPRRRKPSSFSKNKKLSFRKAQVFKKRNSCTL